MPLKKLPKSLLKELASAEGNLKASLKIVRAARRRAHEGPVPAVEAAAAPQGPTLSAASQKRVRIYSQLLGLFASDGKPTAQVRPESVLGDYPLGYTQPGLADFYTYKVNPWFSCLVTTAAVNNTKTVWNLVSYIDTNGGQPR